MQLREWLAQFRETWPNNHRPLRLSVATVLASLPRASFVCGLDAQYLPHGGRDALWLIVTPYTAMIMRTRTLYQAAPVEVARALLPSEGQQIQHELARRQIWQLPHAKHPTTDGFVCAIACITADALHSIQTHNPEGRHRELINYLLGLMPLPAPYQEHDPAQLPA